MNSNNESVDAITQRQKANSPWPEFPCFCGNSEMDQGWSESCLGICNYKISLQLQAQRKGVIL